MNSHTATLQGKIMIEADLELMTGLHIGGGAKTSAIGAVDSPVVRDSITQAPIIPGSSLKGKLRTLLAKLYSEGLVLDKPDNDAAIIKRLFGSSDPIRHSRLQFFDIGMQKKSIDIISQMDTDLYLTEVKYENTINRLTAQANPRQIERVPATAVFNFKLVYNVEDINTLEEDLQALRQGLNLLEVDYLGGHGSRGSGRVHFNNYKFSIPIKREDAVINEDTIRRIFEGAE